MRQVIIADNHPLTRQGLALTLDAEPDLAVCGQAATAGETCDLIDTQNPDLVILDLSLNGMHTLDLIEHIHTHRPALPILVLTEEIVCAERSIRAGAHGYITKRGSCVESEVVHAVRRLLEGGIYVSEDVCEQILRNLMSGPHLSPDVVLSRQELNVYELIGRGRSTREIAEQLHISPKTVDSYRRRIKDKLSLSERTELIHHAMRWVDEYVLCCRAHAC
ncbi:MAG: response regulator [Rhodothermales bacterium]